MKFARMIQLVLWLCLTCTIASNALAQALQHVNSDKPATFNLQGVSVTQVIHLIYGEALKQPYIIDPEVVSDQRLVSFRHDRGDLRQFVSVFLDSLGYEVNRVRDIDVIRKRSAQTVQAATPEPELFVYQPKYREASYLATLLRPLFQGQFTVNNAVAAPIEAKSDKSTNKGSVAGLVDQRSDTLVFMGSSKELQRLASALKQVDIATPQVSVRAVVYEVTKAKSDGSAFQLIASLISGKLGITIDKQATDLGNSLSLKFKGIEAIASMLSTDNRFNVVTNPTVRVKSGEQARFVVGQDVPVLGNVTYQQGGGAVRSVDYRSSGVIFSVSPTVKEGGIDVRIAQQLSSFVRTDTGVNDTPTLTKRELETSVHTQSGELIVIGGLTETKSTHTKRGFSWLPFATSQSNDDSNTELVMLLQIEQSPT